MFASTSDDAPAPERLDDHRSHSGDHEAEDRRPDQDQPPVRTPRGHPRPREPLGKPVGLELVERLGRVEVLQRVRTERPGREAPVQQAASGARHDHLAAVCGGPNASRTSNRKSDVAIALEPGFPGVDSHPHLDLRSVRPLVGGDRGLRGARCGGGIAHPREDGEERLRLPVDDAAAAGLDRLLEQTAVLGYDLAVALLQAVLEQRRPLDVREKQRDGTSR